MFQVQSTFQWLQFCPIYTDVETFIHGGLWHLLMTAGLLYCRVLGIFCGIYIYIFPVSLVVVITEFHSRTAGIPLLFLKYTLQVTFYKERNLIPRKQCSERYGPGNFWTAENNTVRLKYKEPVMVMVEYHMKNYPPNLMFIGPCIILIVE